MRVLLVEDDDLIADAIAVSMGRAGYHVDRVGDGPSAEDAITAAKFDLVLLDLGLPGRDGIDVLRWIRRRDAGEPVVILTAREAVENRIEGLDLGADDYIVKPFDMDELLARCRAQIRRSNGRSVPLLTRGALVVDPAAQSVTYGGARVDLSRLSLRVLTLLLERAGRVVSKDDLAEAIYGWDEGAESNTVEVYVSQIRRRTSHHLIRTIRGVGYTIDRD